MTASPPAMLRFGSLYGRLQSAQQVYTEALALVFGVGLHPLPPDREAGRHFDLTIIDDPGIVPAVNEFGLRSNSLTLSDTPGRTTIATDVLRAELLLDRQPADIRLTVLQSGLDFAVLCVHFGVLVHKMLFLLDRVVLHAAAVELDGVVSVFVGHKGAGKSTTSLALAKAGGTVLGEDQVVLRRQGAGYVVSGGDERSRVTERTERHFFAEPLAAPARDFAGTLKKEIRMGDHFRSRPFHDFPAHRLLFPRIAGKFELRPLKSQQALVRLLAYNGHFQRFEGGRDQAAFLDYLAGFIASVSCWDLSLSDDLHQLDRLVEASRSA